MDPFLGAVERELIRWQNDGPSGWGGKRALAHLRATAEVLPDVDAVERVLSDARGLAHE